ncbi:MAG: efflux RND transporter periplasmic adaptor subunit [Ketobacter sp.]|nr:MAG: efflux RND transporter periplasmic adaptor subunit [Ketobacter sp.]
MNLASRRPLITFVAALFVFGLVLFASLQAIGNPKPPGAVNPVSKQASTQSTTPTVKVTAVSAQPYQAAIKGYGSVAAHYQLTLNSRVSGQVTQVNQDFETGRKVQKGEVLMMLENSSYQAALASANLAYQEALREAEQARTEWTSSGLEGDPESPLVFYEPQLQEARANYEVAEKNLQDTRVSATFDGIVTARSVAPGSYISAGSELGEIISSDRVEIAVPLSSQEWAMLPTLSELSAQEVGLVDVETGRQWVGRVLREEKQLDSATRQRSIVIAVEQPFEQDPALMPGTFVEATLPGLDVAGLWRLPSTCLSQRGKVWYIDEQGTLQNFDAEPIFVDGGYIFVHPPQALSDTPQQVLVSPMNSYVTGTPVMAREEDNNE